MWKEIDILHYILEFSESEVKEYGRGAQKEVPALCSEERLTWVNQWYTLFNAHEAWS